MALPCALFSSSSNTFTPQDFIKHILSVSELPAPDVTTDDTEGYVWDINTKYYKTKIHLCTTNCRTIGNLEFANSVEAFVHFFDPTEPKSFDLAKAWLPYLSHLEPQVQILVCKCSRESDAVTRKAVLTWCIESGFELVELKPDQDSDDEDNDFPETTGLARIIQALHAHTWPNLELKDSPPVQSPLVRQMMREQQLLNQEQDKQSSPGTGLSSTSAINSSNSSHLTSASSDSTPSLPSASASSHSIESPSGAQSNPDSPCTAPGVKSVPDEGAEKSGEALNVDENLVLPDNIEWSSFIEAVSAEGGAEDANIDENDLGVEEFEKLFMQLKVMKDRAENLPHSERKKYAEKVAMSFWNAIGGDPDEIGDLDADSD